MEPAHGFTVRCKGFLCKSIQHRPHPPWRPAWGLLLALALLTGCANMREAQRLTGYDPNTSLQRALAKTPMPRYYAAPRCDRSGCWASW